MWRPKGPSRDHWMIVVFVAAVFGGATSASAQELIGAKALLQEVQAKAAKVSPSKEAAELTKSIRALPGRLETLGPPAAAMAWLAMYDVWRAKPKEIRSGRVQLQFSELIDALPSPEAWPELARLIDARPVEGNDETQLRALALRMLGHRLRNETELLKQDVARMLKLLEPTNPGDDGEGWEKALQSQITVVKQEYDPLASVEDFRAELELKNSEQDRYLTVPDLVRMIGREAASPLLEKALLLKRVYLQFGSRSGFERTENETVKLARELARKHLKELAHPFWDLCHSLETVDLFEAFSAMSSSTDRSITQMDGQAAAWYIAALIVQDRFKDLIKILTEPHSKVAGSRWEMAETSIGYVILPQLERAGHAGKVHAFLIEALSSHPELSFWDVFVSLSARLGQSPRVLTIVDAALARDDLSPATRRHLQTVRANALLASDRVDDGIVQTLKLITESENDKNQRTAQLPLTSALRVARIGWLLKRDEWFVKGTDAAEKIVSNESYHSDLSEFVSLLIDDSQFVRAERLLKRALTRGVADWQPQNGGGFSDGSALDMLVRVYHKAGRHADVVELLEEAPWWSQPDLGEMLAEDSRQYNKHGEGAKIPMSLIAAESLSALGRKDEARRIVSAIVSKWPGLDAGWQLAMELMGDNFPALAERVFSTDRFEERPLIWLSKYHLDRGNIAKAEALARQAIEIDPSDGEQGKGDRMRAYAVLAEILKKKGDVKTAAIYDGAIKAIRLAEQADEFHEAGLLSRGIRMYEESLTHFADAYCIQSRLAVQLAQSGDLAGATEHYQRAFELMPESFGRVESHCFGCEGVFNGQVAEKIAERVFLKLVAAQPTNPRVHYMLGYLRKAEDRDNEAAKSFREAVRLDPDYLNAWQMLLNTPGAALSQEEQDQATFQVLRLDPFGRHASASSARNLGSSDAVTVRDLPRLWTAMRNRTRLRPTNPPSALFALKASAKALAEAERLQRESGADVEPVDMETNNLEGFSSQSTLSAIATLIQSADR